MNRHHTTKADQQRKLEQSLRERPSNEVESSTGYIGHTPGPWTVSKAPEFSATACDVIQGGKDANYPFIAQIYRRSSGKPIKEAQANARLIASAPDYDESARMAVESARDLANGGVEITHEAFIALKAAIAKAEGKQ